MKQRCESCNSCGMPLKNDEDYSMGDTNSLYCKYCTDKTGILLSFDKILKMNAEYFKESQGLTDQAALKMAKDLLKEQPAWKDIEV